MLHKPKDILGVFKSSKILIGVFFHPLLLLAPYVLFINYGKAAYPELELGYLSFLPFILLYVFLNSLFIYFAISNYLAAVKKRRHLKVVLKASVKNTFNRDGKWAGIKSFGICLSRHHKILS